MKLFPYGHAGHPQWIMAAGLVLAQLRAQMALHGYASAPTLGLLYITDHYADAAQEIRTLCLGLEVQGFLTRPSGVRVWTKPEPGFADAVKDALGVRAWVEARPLPVLPEKPGGIFPPEMARA